MTRTVLVTGATGTVGQHVTRSLLERTATVRIGLRDPNATPEALPVGAEVVEFDFETSGTWEHVLAAVDSVFLIRPPTVDAGTVVEFAEAAARSGVGRIAYLSTLGAEKNVLVPHHRIEKRIKRTDASYTLLRASYFMQNLLEIHRSDIVERNEVFVPAGGGRTSFLDARDLGAVAAIVLTEPGHANRAYDLTGPEAIDYETVAGVLSSVLERPITYSEPSLLRFALRTYGRGTPLGFVLLMCGIYTTARLGLAARVTTDTRRVLDREPNRMRAFVEDHATEFRARSE